MTNIEALLSEFDEEMSNTRKILERVPEDRFQWKPHERSLPLGKLSNHVAMLPIFATILINTKAKMPAEAATTADLLDLFEYTVSASRAALASTSDEELAKVRPVIGKPLASVLRNRMMSHLIHHRAQLTVYLRLLDVAVPGMYGPSADEK